MQMQLRMLFLQPKEVFQSGNFKTSSEKTFLAGGFKNLEHRKQQKVAGK